MLLIEIIGELGKVGDKVINSSPPTNIFPQITQIVGLLNTVIGSKTIPFSFSKNKEKLKEIEKKIEVRKIYIVRVPKIIDFSIQRINWDVSKGLTTNVTYQYILNFHYIFEIEFFDKKMEKILKEKLKSREIKFTPVLGSSECLVDIYLTEGANGEVVLEKTEHIKEEDNIVILQGYLKNYIYRIVK